MQAFIREHAADFAPALRVEYERGLDPTLLMTTAGSASSPPEKIEVAGWKKETFVEFFTAKLQGGNKAAAATN